MRGAWQGRVAVVVAAVSVVCTAAGLWLELSAAAAGRPVTRSVSSELVLAVLFPLTGVLVLWREPRNRTGWVLLSGASVGISVLAHQWAYDAAVARPGVLPLAGLMTWLAAWTYTPYFLQPSLLPVLFPRGEIPSPAWRRFVTAVLVVFAVTVVACMVKADDDVEGMGLDNPLGVEAFGVVPMLVQPLGVALLALVATPVAIVGLARRQRLATGVERARLQWLLLGFVACFGLGILSTVSPWQSSLLFSLGFSAIPLSIAVAVVRHGLLDVSVVVNRTIVYGALTGVSVLVYLAVVALAGRYVGADGVGPVVAAGVVALAASARSWVQRLVDRRLFGARSDPMAVVARVGHSVESSADPLTALVEAAGEALRLPSVQVLDSQGRSVAEHGQVVSGTHVFPIVNRGRGLGVLVVGRRSRNERLRTEEQAALREVALRAGSLMREAALGDDLRRSYEQVVQAREEERKRLRHELHDGVGPSLAGMALQLDSLAARLREDPGLARRTEQLRDRLRQTVGEVRAIVGGLRPAALEELGLAGALQALESHDTAVRVSVDAVVPGRPAAAVEVAAYRIAAEAVANAVRHSGAGEVRLTVRAEGSQLTLEVTDDGCGFGADVVVGVGLGSMHERAWEVGGELEIDSAPGRGTTVRASLPVTTRTEEVQP